MNFENVAKAIHCQKMNVEKCWPRIEEALSSLGFSSLQLKIAMLATIAVETAWTFLPVHEYGSDAYLNSLYDTRTDLGNTPAKDSDGAKYCGRGFIQTTGKANYARGEKMLGVPLLEHPELAMEIDVSASLLALFVKDRTRLVVAAEAEQWAKVRKIVNGGTNNLKEFLNVVARLQALAEGDI